MSFLDASDLINTPTLIVMFTLLISRDTVLDPVPVIIDSAKLFNSELSTLKIVRSPDILLNSKFTYVYGDRLYEVAESNGLIAYP